MKNTCGFIIYHQPSKKILFGHVTNNREWSIPKGKQEAEETLLSAALRELSEEANISEEFIATCKVYPLKSQNYNHGKKRLNAFLAITTEIPENIKCVSYFEDSYGNKLPEFDKLQWFSIEEIESGTIEIHQTQMNSILEAIEIIKQNKLK